MRAGKLRKRVALQTEAQTADGRGGYALAWTTSVTVWGSVADELRVPRETYVAQQPQSEVPVAIEIRYRTGVTAGMRALVENVAYNIRAVRDPEGRKRRLILDCERGVAT